VAGRPQRPSGGLDDLLGSLGKKDKLSVIEKSRLDWGQYVRTEDGLAADLAHHGKDGYLDRRAFLDRATERAYEAERAQRLKGVPRLPAAEDEDNDHGGGSGSGGTAP
jgi:hypothetical protein